jgi:GTP-binding protein HflX
VLNKIDQVPDRSYVDVLMMQHPRAVAVSAVTGQGLEDLREAVMAALSADFADAEIETDAGNGRVIAYLSAHAEIYRQQYVDNRVKIRCFLPRHLLHHIQAPDVQVRFLASDA